MALLRRLTGDQKRTVAHWAMEIVVVVAGVLIALWLQEVAEGRRAVANMKAAEEAIHEEVRGNLTTLIWREAISRCHIERAQLLKSMLLAGGSRWPGVTEDALLQNKLSEATGIQTVVPGVYQRPFDDLSTAAWESALATGALAPMDRKRFGQLVVLYNQVGFLKGNRDLESRAAATLSALSLPQELTPETRTRMFEALYQVDTSRFMFRLNGASSLAQLMSDLGWNDRSEIDRYISEGDEEDRKRGTKWRACVRPERNPFANTGN
jgi:hypothetical protein